MAFKNGSFELLYILDSANVWKPIACLTEQSISESSDVIETTTRDNQGWKTFLPTNQEFDISFSGLDNFILFSDSQTTFFELRNLKQNRTRITWRIGDGNYISGQGYITELSESYNIDELISFSGSIIGFGRYSTLVDSIISDYTTRVEALGGSIENVECLTNNVNAIV